MSYHSRKNFRYILTKRNFAILDFQSRGCRPSLYWVCRYLTFVDRCMPIAVFLRVCAVSCGRDQTKMFSSLDQFQISFKGFVWVVVRTITYLWFRLPVISYRSRVQVDSREVLLGHCAVCPRGGTYLWMASTWVWILLRNLVRRSRWLVNTAGRLYILWCMMIWLPSRASGVVRWGPYDFWMIFIYMYLLLEPWSSGLSDWILCLGLERRITQ